MKLPELPSVPTIKRGRQEKERPTTYRGKDIGSKQEWWIIKALMKLEYDFVYQYQLFGGYRRGGFIVDFLVYTVPKPVFLEYYGDYWHEGNKGSDDKLRERIIKNQTNTEVVGIYEKDAKSEEDIFSAVRDVLR